MRSILALIVPENWLASGAYQAAFDQYEKEMRPFVTLNQALGIKSANLMESREKKNVFMWLLETGTADCTGSHDRIFVNRSTRRIHHKLRSCRRVCKPRGAIGLAAACKTAADLYSRFGYSSLGQGGEMPLRLPLALVVLLFALLAGLDQAAAFVDSAERYVVMPDRVGRVMPANQSAAVLVFALAPEKLVGWSEMLPRSRQAYLPAKFARLPAVGSLIRPNPQEAVPLVARARPDLIIEFGPVSPDASARADWFQQKTGVPYVVLDNSIQTTPAMLRTVGAMLGVGQRGEDLGHYADNAINGLRGRLLIASATERPLVYYGRGADGLDAGLDGSQAMAAIDQAGVINVAARLGRGELTRVTRDQILAWNPAIVIAEQRSFYDSLQRGGAWRSLPAVANKRIYLAPADPFGWIDNPPSVNRIIGLHWLAALFYPDQYQQNLHSNVREFYEKFYGTKLSDRQLEALVRHAGVPAGETQGALGVPLLGAEPVPFPSTSPNTPGVMGRPPGRGGNGVAPGLPSLPSVPGTPQ